MLAGDSDAIFTARAPTELATNQPSNALTIAGGDIGTGQATPTSQLAEVLKAAPDLAKGGADLTGLQELQKQLQVESESVRAGRDKAVDASADLTKDLVGKATELAGKAQELAASKQAQDDKEEKTESEKKDADLKAFDKFGENAGDISALVGAQDEDKRQDFFASLFGDFPGGADALKDPSNALTLSKIFGAFNTVNNDADDGSLKKLGSTAALAFLGGLGG